MKVQRLYTLIEIVLIFIFAAVLIEAEGDGERIEVGIGKGRSRDGSRGRGLRFESLYLDDVADSVVTTMLKLKEGKEKDKSSIQENGRQERGDGNRGGVARNVSDKLVEIAATTAANTVKPDFPSSSSSSSSLPLALAPPEAVHSSSLSLKRVRVIPDFSKQQGREEKDDLYLPFHKCRDSGEAYSAAYLITAEHLKYQFTDYNLTWVNCEMGSFIMMNQRAHPQKVSINMFPSFFSPPLLSFPSLCIIPTHLSPSHITDHTSSSMQHI